jgi:hypothetical protein
MSKFLELCKSVEKLLQEEGEIPAADPNAGVAPGEPVQQTDATLDPNTQSEVKDVDNDKLEQLIETIVNFYQSKQALSADAVKRIEMLPAKITKENSEATVEALLDIFTSSDFPEDTSETEV